MSALMLLCGVGAMLFGQFTAAIAFFILAIIINGGVK